MATVKKTLKQNKRKISTEKKKHYLLFLFTNCEYIYKTLSNRNNPGLKENTKPWQVYLPMFWKLPLLFLFTKQGFVTGQ